MRILVVKDGKPVATFVKQGLECDEYALDDIWQGRRGGERKLLGLGASDCLAKPRV